MTAAPYAGERRRASTPRSSRTVREHEALQSPERGSTGTVRRREIERPTEDLRRRAEGQPHRCPERGDEKSTRPHECRGAFSHLAGDSPRAMAYAITARSSSCVALPAARRTARGRASGGGTRSSRPPRSHGRRQWRTGPTPPAGAMLRPSVAAVAAAPQDSNQREKNGNRAWKQLPFGFPKNLGDS